MNQSILRTEYDSNLSVSRSRSRSVSLSIVDEPNSHARRPVNHNYNGKLKLQTVL